MIRQLSTATALAVLFLAAACGQKSSSYKDADGFADRQLLQTEDPGQPARLARLRKSSSSRGIATFDPFASAVASTPQYGMGQFMDWFLGFADYVHWKDSSIIGVVRLSYGQYVPSLEAQKAYGAHWSLKLSSSNPISMIRYKYTRPSSNGRELFIEADLSDEHCERDVLIFAIHSNDTSAGLQAPGQPIFCGPDGQPTTNPVALGSSEDGYDPAWYGPNPYRVGYNGYAQDQYYFYPPPPCAPQRGTNAVTLKLTAAVGQTAGMNNASAPLFEISLDDMVNAKGVAPFRAHEKHDHEIRVRTVNFDGKDWAF